MKNQIASVERHAISVGIIANFVMAISGWAAFYFSGSQALLLDGNMSFVLFLSSIVALKISRIKSIRSEKYPFVLFASEALYAFMKGILLFGILTSALTANAGKVFQYLQGDQINLIKTGPIVIYATAMVIICLGLSFFYHRQNKRINMASPLLKVDQKASLIDGLMSASAGIILVVISYIEVGSTWGFLLYIGDSLLVCLLVAFVIPQPIKIIKEAFIELAGGRLQNEVLHQTITDKVTTELKHIDITTNTLNVSKTGSSYLVVIGLSFSQITTQSTEVMDNLKQKLTESLQVECAYVDVELVLV